MRATSQIDILTTQVNSLFIVQEICWHSKCRHEHWVQDKEHPYEKLIRLYASILAHVFHGTGATKKLTWDFCLYFRNVHHLSSSLSLIWLLWMELFTMWSVMCSFTIYSTACPCDSICCKQINDVWCSDPSINLPPFVSYLPLCRKLFSRTSRKAQRLVAQNIAIQ